MEGAGWIERVPATGRAPRRTRVTPSGQRTLAHAEREALLKVIRANQGNLCHSAAQLGISRNALYRRLRRHGITMSRVQGLSVSPSDPPTR